MLTPLDTKLYSIILFFLQYKKDRAISDVGLVKTILHLLKDKSTNSDLSTYTNEEVTEKKITSFINRIVDGEVKPDETSFLEFTLELANEPHLVELMKSYYENDEKIDENIKRIRKKLRNFYKALKTSKIVSKYSIKLKTSDKDLNSILTEMIAELNEIKENENLDIDFITNQLDLRNPETIKEIAKKSKELVSTNILKTGWSCFNRMLQGGFRRKEMWMISALPHNYKSGLVKSIFAQIIRHNNPFPTKDNKKPLILFISLEEELEVIFFFLYSYLKKTIDDESIDPENTEYMKNLNINEMVNYVNKHLNVNGWETKILRVKANSFTTDKLEQLINLYNNTGYEVQVLFIDYVMKMNRLGCLNQGANGTDLLCVFRTIRELITQKDILFITPHQLSSEADKLVKGGMPPVEFVKHVADKRYYAVSTQLGQELDGELLLRLGKVNGKTRLLIHRGKHRLPTNIPEEYKLIMLDFPDRHSPIPEENDKHKPCSNINDLGLGDEEFDF